LKEWHCFSIPPPPPPPPFLSLPPPPPPPPMCIPLHTLTHPHTHTCTYLPTAAACSSSVHLVEHTSCLIHDGCLASPAVGEGAAEPTGTTTMGHLFPTQGMKCPRPPTSDSPMIHNEATRAWYGVTANL